MLTTKEYLDLKKKYPNPKDNSEFHVHYDGEQEDFDSIVEYNKELVKKYPWLLPYNRWTDSLPDDYDYSYTELDSLPDGWRIAFGDSLCEELQKELERFDYVDKYKIIQIKEKFGGLRWCDGGCTIGKLGDMDYSVICKFEEAPETFNDTEHYFWEWGKLDGEDKWEFRRYPIVDKCRVNDIIRKYERMSYKVCIVCGKPARWRTLNWTTYYCSDCLPKTEHAIPIDEEEWL